MLPGFCWAPLLSSFIASMQSHAPMCPVRSMPMHTAAAHAIRIGSHGMYVRAGANAMGDNDVKQRDVRFSNGLCRLSDFSVSKMHLVCTRRPSVVHSVRLETFTGYAIQRHGNGKTQKEMSGSEVERERR